MEKIMLCFVLVVAVTGQKHHPKFSRNSQDVKPVPTKVSCTPDFASQRDDAITKSRCGEPREVFEYLDAHLPHEQISPRAVWVKRCVGLCEYDNDGSCMPTATVVKNIPVRIYNAKTNKEACATYPVVEHVSCGCCDLSSADCPEPRLFNPRKCTCQCPNIEERRDCLKKRNQNMKWNRSKCTCEKRRRELIRHVNS